MPPAPPRPAPRATRRRRDRDDRGATFVELLVSIVLLGTAVVGTLAALRTTVIGTAVSRDQSKAQQWLQSAAGVIEGESFGDCTTPFDEAALRSYYQTAVDTNATAPFDFAPQNQLTVLDIDVWDGTSYVDFASQTTCYDDFLLRQQLVTMQVTDPDGDVLEELQIVKQDRP
jgi:hypothetical protein